MSSNKSNFGIILNGLVRENPTFVLVLGMCPTLGTMYNNTAATSPMPTKTASVITIVFMFTPISSPKIL